MLSHTCDIQLVVLAGTTWGNLLRVSISEKILTWKLPSCHHPAGLRLGSVVISHFKLCPVLIAKAMKQFMIVKCKIYYHLPPPPIIKREIKKSWASLSEHKEATLLTEPSHTKSWESHHNGTRENDAQHKINESKKNTVNTKPPPTQQTDAITSVPTHRLPQTAALNPLQPGWLPAAERINTGAANGADQQWPTFECVPCESSRLRHTSNRIKTNGAALETLLRCRPSHWLVQLQKKIF